MRAALVSYRIYNSSAWIECYVEGIAAPGVEAGSHAQGIIWVLRSLIDEVLRGSPKTVVGSTTQVSGQVAVDPADPSSAQVGTTRVNARALTTDSEFRDRAIKNRILMTDAHEFVTFTPTGVSGDLAGLAVGEQTELQVSGELAIAGTIQPATFDVTETAVSNDRIEGPWPRRRCATPTMG